MQTKLRVHKLVTTYTVIKLNIISAAALFGRIRRIMQPAEDPATRF
jgi:hypothetical protein